jgi:SAM-dependent methyltransferase
VIPELIGHETKAGVIQRTIRWVLDEEHKLLMHGDRRGDAECLPFMPFQPAEFTAIMLDVVAETSGKIFLDVGCGSGTKMTLAQEIYGLTCWGIEIDPEMGAQAEARFPKAVLVDDALYNHLATGFYGNADIIWLYRPFRDPDKQAALEKTIMGGMKHGAILAGSKWQMDESPFFTHGWQPIVDDWETKTGAWMKP